MTQPNIKHLWLDFSDTISTMDKAVFEKFVYTTYAEMIGKQYGPEIADEYKKLLVELKSNAAVLKSVGLSGTALADRAASLTAMHRLTDPNIPAVVKTLKDIVPVSVFSNSRLDAVLPALGLEIAWFTHILGPDRVKEPKPSLEGSQMMVELSHVPAAEILYIGDDVGKDVLPAKAVGMKAGLMWKESEEADYCFKDFKAVEALFL